MQSSSVEAGHQNRSSRISKRLFGLAVICVPVSWEKVCYCACWLQFLGWIIVRFLCLVDLILASLLSWFYTCVVSWFVGHFIPRFVDRFLPSFLDSYVVYLVHWLLVCLFLSCSLDYLFLCLIDCFADILFPCLLVGERYLACMVDYSMLACVIYLGFFRASLFFCFVMC
jgi:hypothetical protein